MKQFLGLSAALLLGGCAASSVNVKSLVLPTSNKTIDVVQHRSSVEFLDCGTLIVLQTYSASGELIDSKDARGNALHCDAITAGIQAGGMVGAAHALRPSRNSTNVDNSNANSAEQGQIQIQGQSAVSSSVSTATASSASNSSASALGGAGGQGGIGGVGGNGGSSTSAPIKHWAPKGNPSIPEKPKGNNGYGNGGHDGSPNGKEDKDR